MTRANATIGPNRAPGLLVACTVDAAGEVLAEEVLDPANVRRVAEEQAAAALAGDVAAVHIYDGDTGCCVLTIRSD